MLDPTIARKLDQRLMPIAAYLREADPGDGTVIEAALGILADYHGRAVVVVDPDPDLKLEDLGDARWPTCRPS